MALNHTWPHVPETLRERLTPEQIDEGFDRLCARGIMYRDGRLTERGVRIAIATALMNTLSGPLVKARAEQRRAASTPVNVYVEDAGHRYRICCTPGSKRVLMVLRKTKRGAEMALDTDGPRARELVKKANL